MDPNSLPGNSQTKRPTQAGPHTPRQPVVQASVIPAGRKSFGQKFKEAFFAQGTDDFGTFLARDILVPTIKGTIMAAVVGGIGALFYGQAAPRWPGMGFGGYGYNPYSWGAPRFGAQPTNFTDYGALARVGSTTPNQQQLPPKGPNAVSPTDIFFHTRAEAELVKDSLAEILVTYHVVTLLDYYETCGVPGNGYTDAYVGWTDLSQLRIREGYGGWVIDLPKPKPIQR